MSASHRPRVAVIGGGIFGVCAALELGQDHEVDLYEKNAELFQGATFANHNRHHHGYHYPRSPETARQCLESRRSFAERFGNAVIEDFPAYYCVSKDGSKISGAEYLAFCDATGLEYVDEWPALGMVDPTHLSQSIRVPEGVCDFSIMRELAYLQIKSNPRVRCHTAHSVRSARLVEHGAKELEIESASGIRRENYDFVVSAVYANYNLFCSWFGFERKPLQFNLQELDILELPAGVRIGLTVMDGSFASLIPYGNSRFHILAHVDESQLIRESSTNIFPLISRLPSIESRWDEVFETTRKIFPVLDQARYRRSIFVDRVVDPSLSATDARLSELTEHGHGCYSIFAGKVITCVSTARKLANEIRAIR